MFSSSNDFCNSFVLIKQLFISSLYSSVVTFNNVFSVLIVSIIDKSYINSSFDKRIVLFVPCNCLFKVQII